MQGVEASPSVQLSGLGLVFNQPMPESIMRAWIAHMCMDRKVSILRFYKDFLENDKTKYGFHESWEWGIFEENMMQFIRLVIPGLYFVSNTLSPIALTSLAINALTVLRRIRF